MSLEIPDYTNILIELNKAVKMHNFYPEGHPQLDAALDRSYVLFRKRVDDVGEIRWKIDQKGFYDGKTLLAPAQKDLVLLAKKFFFRRIKELAVTTRMTLSDIKVLLTIVKMEPEAIQEDGGVEAVLAKNDVQGVLVNALNYNDLKKLKKELEEKRLEEEKNAEAARKKAEEEIGENSEGDEEAPLPPIEEAPPDEPLMTLVRRLKLEKDFLRYQDLAVRIKEKTDVQLLENNLNPVFTVALVFNEHSLTGSPLSDDIKKTASESLKALLTGDMVTHLVERIGAKEEGFRSAIQQMLVKGGTEAAELLLSAIIDAQEALERRNYFNALVAFGPSIRELVEGRLDSPQWYVVRQMVSLLGELGDPAALDAIEKTYEHPDMRVKRDVLKSLMKISSPRSTQILLRALNEDDQTLVTQAIISLGVLKDPTVIDTLGAIALKREAFADLMEPKKEAIKALGVIGDPRAVPYLAQILSKKVWFGKKTNEDARVMSAYALGNIGTPEAVEAIKKTLDTAEGGLYAACKRILEGREKANGHQ